MRDGFPYRLPYMRVTGLAHRQTVLKGNYHGRVSYLAKAAGLGGHRQHCRLCDWRNRLHRNEGIGYVLQAMRLLLVLSSHFPLRLALYAALQAVVLQAIRNRWLFSRVLRRCRDFVH
jgi:hypothetical protein